MPLVMPENVHLEQMDALSHSAGIALPYEMSRYVAHSLSQKKIRILTQNRTENLVVELEPNPACAYGLTGLR